MKAKTCNIIAIILLVIALIVSVTNAVNLADTIHEYYRVSALPNASGVDWLAFGIGIAISVFLSVVAMAISFFTLFLGYKKYLKIISAVLFLLNGAVLLGMLIYRYG